MSGTMDGRIVLVGLAICVALAGCQSDQVVQTPMRQESVRATSAQEALFTLVPPDDLTNEQQHYLDIIQRDPVVGDLHLGRLNAAASALLEHGGQISIPVSPSASLAAIGSRVVRRAPDDVSWAGPINADNGWVQLVLGSAGVYATVRTRSNLLRIVPIGGGLHAIVDVDASKFPPDHPPGMPSGVLRDTSVTEDSSSTPARLLPTKLTPLGRGAPDVGQFGQIVLASHSSDDIDLLVVYTASAAAATQNIATLVQLAIDETNTSYSNSGVSFSVGAVHTAQVDYDESGRSFDQHVTALEAVSDGLMDTVHVWRNQYLADVVVLLVDDSEACGRATQILATHTSAFAAVHYSCATGYYSFGHELGHLQGARHDRHVDNSSTPFQYGHGYVDPNKQWRTIMAYPDDCSGCARVQYWSNPNVTYPPTSQAMGTTTYEHNARVLNETESTVAAFRAHMSVDIYGPTTVKSYQWCTWYAIISGNVPAATYEWSGIASGTSSSVISVIPQSGNLSVEVSDGWGRGSDRTIYVTVDDFAPDC